MATLETLTRDEYALLARLARRYWIDERTQEQLASELGLSRQKVQRLLDRARATGVVDIRISVPPWLHLELEAGLRDAFGLREAIVAPARDDPSEQRAEVARGAAAWLERHVHDGSVVAVSHGRDTGEIPRFYAPRPAVDATFVAAMGGSPSADAPTNPNEIVRRLADRAGATAMPLYAPAYVEREAIRAQLLRESAVADTLRAAAGASIALVGIGGVDDGCTMVGSGCISLDEIRRLRAAGAVGDVLGHYVDVGGAQVRSDEAARLISLGMDDLRRIETVVAVVSEREKPAAILGALRTAVVDVLVVDEPNAQRLLEAAGEPDGRPGSEV